jgi:hypothetical protein
MADLLNYGTPTVANKAFVPLAVEAGIVDVIASIVTLAMDKKTLLIRLVEALSDTNPELAAALNHDTLDAILRYMAKLPKAPVALTSELPEMVNESGPASVAAGRDGGTPTQVNVTFSDRPAGYRYAIYLDGVLQKVANLDGAAGYVNEAVSDVAVDGQQHTIRVLFVTDELAITRFGPIATFS